MSNETLFRKSSLNSISSPEQLNEYIKVSNPSVWLVLAALFVLLAGVFVWGVTGSLPTTVSARGVAREGEVLCYISTEEAAAIGAGQKASRTGADGEAFQGRVMSVGSIPVSASEIAGELSSDYLVRQLVSNEFAVRLVIAPLQAAPDEEALLAVSIVTEAVRPIDFLLK